MERAPGGGSSGFGTSPATAVRALPVISRSGTASSSIRVYGCRGAREQRARRRQLDDAAEVHHADAIGDVVDDREVVRDEEIGEAEPLLQVAHQVQHLRLHRDVERGRRLVADEEAAARSTARARSRSAAAGRRRTDADTSRRRRAARPTCASSAATRAATSARGVCRRLRADRLGDDVGDAPARIEARVGILEDHLHPAPRRRSCAAPSARPSPASDDAVVARSCRASARRGRRSAARPSTCRSPTRRRGRASRPWRSRGSTPSTAFRIARGLRSSTRSSHGGETSKYRATSVELEQRRRSCDALRAAARPSRAASTRPRVRAAPASSSGRSLAAALERARAARMERAAGRESRVEPRHRAVDLGQALALLDDRRNRSHQAHACTDARAGG